jgi:hypothetical protein
VCCCKTMFLINVVFPDPQEFPDDLDKMIPEDLQIQHTFHLLRCLKERIDRAQAQRARPAEVGVGASREAAKPGGAAAGGLRQGLARDTKKKLRSNY